MNETRAGRKHRDEAGYFNGEMVSFNGEVVCFNGEMVSLMMKGPILIWKE